jgi:opacity protein-like surface antigen
MKKVFVIVFVVVGLLFATCAEAAAKPHHRRTRNANRIGPYAGAMIGLTQYPESQSQAESNLADIFNGVTTQNLVIGTDDKDLGYAAQFGYRFARYLAVEFALGQYGVLNSHARAQIDPGTGFVPASIDLKFHVGGPKLTAIGILPINNKFEIFGQVGLLFASTEREFVIRIDGADNSFGSIKADSTELTLGAGASWHINQMYTVRLGYERLTDVGDKQRNGTEDLNTASLGLVVRF